MGLRLAPSGSLLVIRPDFFEGLDGLRHRACPEAAQLGRFHLDQGGRGGHIVGVDCRGGSGGGAEQASRFQQAQAAQTAGSDGERGV